MELYASMKASSSALVRDQFSVFLAVDTPLVAAAPLRPDAPAVLAPVVRPLGDAASAPASVFGAASVPAPSLPTSAAALASAASGSASERPPGFANKVRRRKKAGAKRKRKAGATRRRKAVVTQLSAALGEWLGDPLQPSKPPPGAEGGGEPSAAPLLPLVHSIVASFCDRGQGHAGDGQSIASLLDKATTESFARRQSHLDNLGESDPGIAFGLAALALEDGAGPHLWGEPGAIDLVIAMGMTEQDCDDGSVEGPILVEQAPSVHHVSGSAPRVLEWKGIGRA